MEIFVTYLNRLLDKNKEVIFIPNPGNAGDMVINQAIIDYLDGCCIDYKIMNNDRMDFKAIREGIVLYCPAGGLVPHYKKSQEIIAALLNAKLLVLLPCTVRDQTGLLEKLDANVIVMTREDETLKYVSEIINEKSLIIDSEDCALILNVIKNN